MAWAFMEALHRIIPEHLWIFMLCGVKQVLIQNAQSVPYPNQQKLILT